MHRPPSTDAAGVCCAMLIAAALAGCQREERTLRLDPASAAALNDVRLMPDGTAGAPPQIFTALGKPYADNAYDLSQGKRLYSWFGCRQCHADDRTGIAPSFLAGRWRYGPSLASIVVSIRDGRPGGMPSFHARLTTEQIWQLAGYVQTLGAYSAKTSAPGRDDAVQTRPAENRAPASGLFDRLSVQ
ncbi:c-type cytochrome [Afipia sp. P52-10]|uniref:c-type cytochrome n=1 Tax=Afipia sp. P52-10 TaxID=1429916 RepID=UPI000687D5E6